MHLGSRYAYYYRGETEEESTWILATGFWDDDGLWDDTASWID